ncbi:hypothetical protein Dimus_002681 [Dionaea muscipula]
MGWDPRKYQQIVVKENDIHNIILSYLVHNCFKDTVESFITSTGMQQAAGCLEEVNKRKEIIDLVLAGKVMEAFRLTYQMAPDILSKNRDTLFYLLGLHFVELVRSKRRKDAVEFAQKVFTLFLKAQGYRDRLGNFMLLLAYDEPEKSPMHFLLSFNFRQLVAERLNRAILTNASRTPLSSLERLIKQTLVVGQVLNQEHSKDERPPFSRLYWEHIFL